MNLTLQQTKAIKNHAVECYPEEMCGLIVRGDFIPMANLHKNPKENFTISELDMFAYLGEIDAIVHSHCYDRAKPTMLDIRTPSVEDIIGQKASGIPWFIVGTEGENLTEPVILPRESNNTYLGRPFIWFINDCYTIIQDYYEFELGITLREHRHDIDFKDIRKLDKLFKDDIIKYGFEATTDISDMQNGDLLLLDNTLATQSHLGIYHNGEIIHQDEVSVSVPFATFIGRIHKVLKYVG